MKPSPIGQWALYYSQDKPCPLYQKDRWYTWWLYYSRGCEREGFIKAQWRHC